MAIARSARPSPDPDRPARTTRWLAALLMAAVVLAATVVPAFATDPSPSAAAEEPASPSVSADPSASVSPDPDPSTSPSQSADPSASADPSPSPDPSASPSESPSATPAPTPSATPAPWPTTVATLGSTVTFYGRGYGHGVGLSQYGARGRALAGQTFDQILAAYFKGTTLATTGPTRNTRVLVLGGFDARSTRPLTIYGRGGAWTIDGIDRTFPANAVVRIWRASTGWKLRVLAADLVTVLAGKAVSGSVYVRPGADTTRLQLWSKPSTYDTYRGILRVYLKDTYVNVVNHVQLDLYLRGVVPVEMPASWPTEALKAQAVAARSYAVRRLKTTGTFDVYDDTRSQVYRGVEAERSATNAVIAAAPGAILMSGSAVVNAFFHSTGGAATENNEYAFVGSSGAVTSGPVKYLRGISDRPAGSAPYDAASPWYSWRTTTLTRAQLSAVFRTDSRTSVGDLLKLDLTRRGVSGRLYRVTLYGTAGSKTVSGDVFRAVYNAARPAGTAMLRSNLFDVAPLP